MNDNETEITCFDKLEYTFYSFMNIKKFTQIVKSLTSICNLIHDRGFRSWSS